MAGHRAAQEQHYPLCSISTSTAVTILSINKPCCNWATAELRAEHCVTVPARLLTCALYALDAAITRVALYPHLLRIIYDS